MIIFGQWEILDLVGHVVKYFMTMALVYLGVYLEPKHRMVKDILKSLDYVYDTYLVAKRVRTEDELIEQHAKQLKVKSRLREMTCSHSLQCKSQLKALLQLMSLVVLNITKHSWLS